MAVFTLAEIETQLSAWKAALLAVSAGKSYQIGGRSLTRSDAAEIRKTLEWLDMERAALQNSGGRGPVVLVGRPGRQA